ncbi:MAG: signal recognition particle-docking protein FtsY [Nanoarchaeota archaeon]|nr:signal recognition particle-docking protein FtsY [Nanoarchaeota archaeon]
MFSKLKEKLKNWAKKFSDEAKVEEIEEPKSITTKKEKEVIKSSKKKETKVPASQDENLDSKEDKVELAQEFEEKETIESRKEQKKKSILSFFKKQTPTDSEKSIHPVQVEKMLPSKGTPQETPASPDKVLDKEEDKKELAEEFEEKEESFFKKIISKVQKVKISEKEFDVYGEELEMLLLENNVALEVAEKIIKELKGKLVGKEILKKEVESEIYESLKDAIYDILIDPFLLADEIRKKKSVSDNPYVILFCGINGTGKTTTIAKIASQLKSQGIKPILAAADTFRSAAVEQIKTHGDRLGIKTITSEYGSDPASVGFDAIQYAKKNHADVVLIDTAGRMHTNKNLLKEIEKISHVCKPDTKIFVGESITGNDAIEQVRSFNEAIGIDGIILTKADIDEKGGTALSVGYVTKKPILYLGTGQEYKSIEPFNKSKFIESLGLD